MLWRTLLFIFSTVLTCCTSPRAQPLASHYVFPDRIIQAKDQPAVAVFKTWNCSYALSDRVRAVWNTLPTEQLDIEEFNIVLDAYPVRSHFKAANAIAAHRTIDSNVPGFIVIRDRYGVPWRHYIDSIPWLSAFGKERLIVIDEDELLRRYPRRGPNLHRKPLPKVDEWCVILHFPNFNDKHYAIEARDSYDAERQARKYASLAGTARYSYHKGRCTKPTEAKLPTS